MFLGSNINQNFDTSSQLIILQLSMSENEFVDISELNSSKFQKKLWLSSEFGLESYCIEEYYMFILFLVSSGLEMGFIKEWTAKPCCNCVSSKLQKNLWFNAQIYHNTMHTYKKERIKWKIGHPTLHFGQP